MLAKVTRPTNDFFALARYLVQGKPGTKPKPTRVAWVMPHNLPTDDPLLAATYMSATAALSKRSKAAAYHAMIAWAPDEQPTADDMRRIAAMTLELAGLSRHQALIMGHGDTKHPHLHMLINRIDPETGTAWDTAHDYRRFDRIMRLLADAHGFKYAPAHAFNRDLTDELPTKPNSPATYAARRGASTNRVQWSRKASRDLGRRLSADLELDSPECDIKLLFAREGLTLEAKGRGFVAGSASSYSKLSALGLSPSIYERMKTIAERPKTDARKVEVAPTQRRPWYDVDGVDIVRAMATIGVASAADIRTAVIEEQRVRAMRYGRRLGALSAPQDVGQSLAASTALSSRREDVRLRKGRGFGRGGRER